VCFSLEGLSAFLSLETNPAATTKPVSAVAEAKIISRRSALLPSVVR
jgi:hypothetical protein